MAKGDRRVPVTKKEKEEARKTVLDRRLLLGKGRPRKKK
jgi:hypothetical protein